MAVLALLVLAGCVTLSPEESFNQVANTAQVRLGKRISWDAGQYEDPLVRSTIGKLLSRPLTPETAAQVALLNNRELQSTYADLGISQANVVQATLWRNPIVTGVVFFPITGGGIDYTFDFALRVIDIIYIPLRKRVAESELDEIKFQVMARVMSIAGQTYLAFIDYVGEQERVSVLRRAVESASAIVESGRALRKAGNITDYDFEIQVALQVQVAADLARAQMSAAEARERVNRLLGLTGLQTQWRGSDRLPRASGTERLAADAERTAIEASVNLAVIRQRLITMGRKYKVVDITSVLPRLDLGGREQRDVGEEEAGPLFAIELPLFDWGQAKREAARMEILKTRDAFTALAVRIRSFARLEQAKLLSARQIVTFYANTVVPQAQRLLEAAGRQYDAMEIGVFDLIQIKEKQIQVSVDYVAARKTYWRERVRMAQILKGDLPDDANEMRGPAPGSAVQIASPTNQTDSSENHEGKSRDAKLWQYPGLPSQAARFRADRQ
jgi:outer membrane protein, heavy metal efflux system